MKPPFPSFTQEWHNAPYAAIDPTRSELSAAGKTVIITGAGTGVGAATTRAYAEAGAAKIAIIARREHLLQETKNKVQKDFPNTEITVYVADITNEGQLKAAASQIGQWDILILNAAAISAQVTIATCDVDDWWRAFEINVKGALLTTRAFLPNKKERSSIIGISSGFVSLPPDMQIRSSSYAASKTAFTKMIEILAVENPDIFITNVHPGVVDSEMNSKSTELKDLPRDDIALPANYLVWVTSDEARFLHGKFSYCNWDVDELKSKAEQIQNTPTLTINLLDWPWGWTA